jgi:MoaA/NifB/PqqE/SkfB family radical SAM enzyme
MNIFLWNNVNQLKKIKYRYRSYFPIAYKAIKKGVSVKGLIISRFPFYFPFPKRPASLSVELTDACDITCLYCNNPSFANPRTFMSEDIFNNLIKCLDEFKKIDRIRVGGGEPTLHPHFNIISEKLAKKTNYLSIVTNAQWKKEGICETLLNHYDLIELSVDAGGKDVYESSRIGAKYDLLIKNLEELKNLKRLKKNTSAHINLRFMVRPSNDFNKEKEYSFWKKFCDTIMPQYIIYDLDSNYSHDVYQSKHTFENIFPKCTMTYKDMQIRANGNVPLCQITGSALDLKKKLIIGNISKNSLKELWNGEQMDIIRKAHKYKTIENMEICRGCRGA